MSFLRRMLGAATFEDERTRGDREFEARNWGEARQAYLSALDRKKKARSEDIEHCEAQIDLCLDYMSSQRIDEAEVLIEEGHIDLATEELRSAYETAASPEVAKRAREILEGLEQEDARELAAIPAQELTDDERWAILAGRWSTERLEEYDEYGDELRTALLALEDGEGEEALPLLESIRSAADDPAYIYLEIGRARVLAGDEEGARKSLRRFLKRVPRGADATEARLTARMELAGICERGGDEEGAIGALSRAMKEAPEDTRPYLAMGRYLRNKGHADQAGEVLDAGAELLEVDRPDWRYLEEAGLAHLDAGNKEQAATYFDQVIQLFVHLRRLEFPPQTAEARARLYEEEGRLDRAADLYRGLTTGPASDESLRYHREAARLLLELELINEARLMLSRALVLAEGEEKVEIEGQLAELE